MFVKITKSEISNLIEFIKFYFIDSIRSDPAVDNIDYIVDMMNVLTKLRDAFRIIQQREEDD